MLVCLLPRSKNLILLILLLGVLGLLPAVVPTQAAGGARSENVHEKLEELYSSYGLTGRIKAFPSSQTLYAIEIENPDASNAAQALLGNKYTAGKRPPGCLQIAPPSSARCSSAAPGS